MEAVTTDGQVVTEVEEVILRIVMTLEGVPGHDEPLTTRRGITHPFDPKDFENWLSIKYLGGKEGVVGEGRPLSGVESVAVTEVLNGIRAMDHVLEREGIEWPHGPRRR